jgi:hypothetical protein
MAVLDKLENAACDVERPRRAAKFDGKPVRLSRPCREPYRELPKLEWLFYRQILLAG